MAPIQLEAPRSLHVLAHASSQNCGSQLLDQRYMDGELAIEELLEHLRFQSGDDWATYYHARCHADALKATVLRNSSGACAFDTPMLMASLVLHSLHRARKAYQHAS